MNLSGSFIKILLTPPHWGKESQFHKIYMNMAFVEIKVKRANKIYHSEVNKSFDTHILTKMSNIENIKTISGLGGNCDGWCHCGISYITMAYNRYNNISGLNFSVLNFCILIQFFHSYLSIWLPLKDPNSQKKYSENRFIDQ